MMPGSFLSAIYNPLNSVFHEGWRTVTTFVPSVRYIFFGSAMSNGIRTPMRVRIRKPI